MPFRRRPALCGLTRHFEHVFQIPFSFLMEDINA